MCMPSVKNYTKIYFKIVLIFVASENKFQEKLKAKIYFERFFHYQNTPYIDG